MPPYRTITSPEEPYSCSLAVIKKTISELGQPLQSYFGLYRQFTITKAAEECTAHGGVSATGPELHLDVSALQRNVLLLEVSTLQGPELHLDVSALCTTE